MADDLGYLAFVFLFAIVFALLVQRARNEYRARKARDRRRAEWLRKARRQR